MKKEKIFSSFSVLPQEEMLEIKSHLKSLNIGVLKETSFQENRVILTPDSVGLLVANGHSVIIEKGAGDASNFSDNEYIEKGAKIAITKEEVLKSEFVLKIEPLTNKEVSLLKFEQKLVSAVQMSTQTKQYFNNLNKKRITSFGFEFIEDNHGKLPIVRAMSEIAGNTSILLASEYLSNYHNGKGLMLGGVSGLIPTNIVIIGAGTVSEYACRTALGLGASVTVFDDSSTKLRRLQNNINYRVGTSTLQPKVLLKSLKRADVVIAALRVGNKRVPCVVNEEIVKEMKPGAVIVDVGIDQGGCFETSEVTSHKKPTYIKHDVVHYCVPNIASRVSRTASMAISNIITPLLLKISNMGGLQKSISTNNPIRKGIYTFNGNLTNNLLSKYFNIPSVDIDLIISSKQ